jgi:hypothetical protein
MGRIFEMFGKQAMCMLRSRGCWVWENSKATAGKMKKGCNVVTLHLLLKGFEDGL